MTKIQEIVTRKSGSKLRAEIMLDRAIWVVGAEEDDLIRFYKRPKARDDQIMRRQIAATSAAKRKRKATADGEDVIKPVKQARY